MSKKKIVIISTIVLVIIIGIVLWLSTAKNEASGYSYSDEYISLGYVPDGLELISNEIGIKTKIYFFSDEKHYFDISIGSINAQYSFDTENGTSENLEINNMEAFFISTDLTNTLVWTDTEVVYSISSNLDKETIILIAENTNQ